MPLESIYRHDATQQTKKPPSERITVCVFSMVLVAGAGFEPRSTPKQNHSLLPMLIYHPPEVRGTTTPNLHPTPRPNSIHIQQKPQLTSVRRPRCGGREALTTRRCPRSTAQGPWTTDLGAWTLALGPWSMAVIQTVIQNRALADRC